MAATVVFVGLGLIVLGMASGFFSVPSVVGSQNSFGNVNGSTPVIETDLIVTNPNPVGARFGGITVKHTVSMNGIAMATGTKEGLSVATGESMLEFTTLMRNEKLPAWWVSHLRNGETTELRISVRVHSTTLGQSVSVPHTQEIRTDRIGQFNSTVTRPVDANQPFVSDPILYINRTDATWGTITQAETPIDLRFVVDNPNTTPFPITEIGYGITMNNVNVGTGRSEEPYVIPGHTDKTIETTTAINPGAGRVMGCPSRAESGHRSPDRVLRPGGTADGGDGTVPPRHTDGHEAHRDRRLWDETGNRHLGQPAGRRDAANRHPPAPSDGSVTSPSLAGTDTATATDTLLTAVPTPTETDDGTRPPPGWPTPEDPIDIFGNETDTLPAG